MDSINTAHQAQPWLNSARAAALRWLLAAGFIGAGVAHLVWPHLYRSIMPAYLPAPDVLIAASGVALIIGGVGLLWRAARRASGLGLMLLLLAVFPANVEMLRDYHERGVAWWGELLLWLRLPLQALLVWAVWRVSRCRPPAFQP